MSFGFGDSDTAGDPKTINPKGLKLQMSQRLHYIRAHWVNERVTDPLADRH